MIRKVRLFFIVILFFPSLVCAREPVVNNDTVVARNAAVRDYKNLAKINTIALVLNNVSLMCERQLNKHWTVLAAGGYR